MGKNNLFTSEQKLIFNKVTEDGFLRSNFYFTGGTALSYLYLQHRYSDDLDFFTEKKFDNETILGFISRLSKICDFTFTSTFNEVVYIFNLTFKNGQKLKVDFGYYPYSRVVKSELYEGMQVDSLLDIAVNKLLTINQRITSRDFVDLYFLLKQFTIWDIIHGLKVKFGMKTDPFLLSVDLSKAEDLTDMPRMIKPLTLDELKEYFRELAKNLARKSVI